MLVALVAGAAFPAHGATVAVAAERDGDTIAIHAAATLKADATTAWRVLTDYERYPQFIPELRSSRVVARRGGVVTVEQSGDVTLWLFRLPMAIRFEIEEDPPHALRSRATSGSLRALASRYELTATGAGVRLEYAGRVAPGFELLGYLEQVAVEQNVTRQFQALADEIERQSNVSVTGSADGAH